MNVNSLDTLCAGLCYAMDVTPPAYAAEPNRDLTNYIDHAFEGKKADTPTIIVQIHNTPFM